MARSWKLEPLATVVFAHDEPAVNNVTRNDRLRSHEPITHVGLVAHSGTLSPVSAPLTVLAECWPPRHGDGLTLRLARIEAASFPPRAFKVVPRQARIVHCGMARRPVQCDDGRAGRDDDASVEVASEATSTRELPDKNAAAGDWLRMIATDTLGEVVWRRQSFDVVDRVQQTRLLRHACDCTGSSNRSQPMVFRFLQPRPAAAPAMSRLQQAFSPSLACRSSRRDRMNNLAG